MARYGSPLLAFPIHDETLSRLSWILILLSFDCYPSIKFKRLKLGSAALTDLPWTSQLHSQSLLKQTWLLYTFLFITIDVLHQRCTRPQRVRDWADQHWMSTVAYVACQCWHSSELSACYVILTYLICELRNCQFPPSAATLSVLGE